VLKTNEKFPVGDVAEYLNGDLVYELHYWAC
jgi:hypothetical protein